MTTRSTSSTSTRSGLTSMTVEALKDFDISKKDAERAKNMFALGLLSWLYNRPTEGTDQFLETKFARNEPIMKANVTALQRGLELRRDHRGLLGLLRGQAGGDAARAPTATSPATRRWPTGWSPRRSGPGCRCSSAPTRSRRPRTSCTSCPSTSTSASGRSRPRTRSPPSARRSGRRTADRWGDLDLRARPGAQAGDHRAGRLARAAADHRRRAARRPVDRACRPRPSRPTCCRRCSAATARRRCRSSRRGRRPTASTPRSRPCGSRRHLPHAGDPALRRLPGQRVRAVADPCRRRPARPARRVRDRAQQDPRGRDHRLLALPARPRDAGPAVGDSGHRRARAPHRRHREGRRLRQHLLRPGQPRPHGAAPAGQGRRHRRDIPPLEVDDPAGEARVLVLGWGSTYGPIGAACQRVRRAGHDVAQAHLRHLNPFPADLGEVLRRYDKVLVPEMNLGPARAAARREVPRRRHQLQPGARAAVQGRRARHRHPDVDRGVTQPDQADPALNRRRRAGPGAQGPRTADREGVHLRPGGALVPGLRRLRDPGRRAGLPARARAAPREHRLRLRDRLLVAVPRTT